ncbi:MAG: HAD hydrolase-like protein [Lachnospiraceae bacterium]|nr:HAD hydrolase-like protein [Lachnospiraceae bacterium]
MNTIKEKWNMKAVIFDLDDTLILEKDYVLSGYRAVAEALSGTEGFMNDPEEIIKKLSELFDESPKNVFNRLYESFGLKYTKDDIMSLVEIYRTHDPEIKMLPDASEAIAALKNEGFFLGILSDGYLVTQQKKIKAIGAEAIFDGIVLTDELGRDYWKPSIKGFEVLSQRLNVGLNEMVYVGDNPKKDFEIMKNSPIKTVRVIREDGVYRDSEYGGECRENIRTDSLKGLGGIIGKL